MKEWVSDEQKAVSRLTVKFLPCLLGMAGGKWYAHRNTVVCKRTRCDDVELPVGPSGGHAHNSWSGS